MLALIFNLRRQVDLSVSSRPVRGTLVVPCLKMHKEANLLSNICVKLGVDWPKLSSSRTEDVTAHRTSGPLLSAFI